MHTAQEYIKNLSHSLSSLLLYDSLEISSDHSSGSGTRQKPNKHLIYYIEVDPKIHDIFYLLSLIDMTQWTQYWIRQKLFCLPFVLVYYRLILHGTKQISF